MKELFLAFLVFKSFNKLSKYWLQSLFAVPVVRQTAKE